MVSYIKILALFGLLLLLGQGPAYGEPGRVASVKLIPAWRRRTSSLQPVTTVVRWRHASGRSTTPRQR